MVIGGPSDFNIAVMNILQFEGYCKAQPPPKYAPTRLSSAVLSTYVF